MDPQMLLLASGTPDGRVFGLDLQTLIQIGIQLFNTSFLAAVLAFLLYNPVRHFMRKRSDKIKSQMDQAASDIEKANDLKIKYEKMIGEIEKEREEILNSAHSLASDNARQIIDEAKSEAHSIRERAAADIVMERERAKAEIKQAIIEVSSAMASKFVAHAIDGDVQDRLFDETMAELEEVTWRN